MSVTTPAQAAGVAVLGGIRVLDVSDELGAYASRLLADLGADVIRVEPPGGDRTRTTGPIIARADGSRPVSAFDLFVNAGKRSVTLDYTSPESRDVFLELVRTADVLIEGADLAVESAGLTHERLREERPELVHVQITPFGRDHLPRWSPADDLVIMAAGGLLHLGGYPDVGPIVAHGGQSRFAGSIFAAVSVLAALIGREESGEGTLIDVSSQECVAQALEDSAATYALTGHIRDRQGERPREAGTGIYPCADGYVSMVAGRLGTAKAWTSLVQWLNDEDAEGADVLQAPEWSEFSYRQRSDAIDTFAGIFRAFTRSRTKLELYEEAQRRLIALSPVSTIDDVLDNPQLRYREFFVDVDDVERGRELTMPGAPYRLSRGEVARPGPAPVIGEHSYDVLVSELGLTDEEYVRLVERGEA